MFGFELLARCGVLVFARFVAAELLVLVLHLACIPLVVATQVLDGIARRVDAWATRLAMTTPTRPINRFTTPAAAHPARPVRTAAPVMGGAR